MPYFGFKAKLRTDGGLQEEIVLCLILDSRQNIELPFIIVPTIVLCLILDSRQNVQVFKGGSNRIVLCLILDSRQN